MDPLLLNHIFVTKKIFNNKGGPLFWYMVYIVQQMHYDGDFVDDDSDIDDDDDSL